MCGAACLVLAVASAGAAEPAPASTASSVTAKTGERPASSGRRIAERTLDAITIEGEIAVPQVLFITSREQPRYNDQLHRRYMRTSLDVGERASLASRVIIKE